MKTLFPENRGRFLATRGIRRFFTRTESIGWFLFALLALTPTLFASESLQGNPMEFSSPFIAFASIDARNDISSFQPCLSRTGSSDTFRKSFEFSNPKNTLTRYRYLYSEESNPLQRTIVVPVPVEVLDQLYADALPCYEINIRLVPESEAETIANTMTREKSLPLLASTTKPAVSIVVPASQLNESNNSPVSRPKSAPPTVPTSAFSQASVGSGNLLETRIKDAEAPPLQPKAPVEQSTKAVLTFSETPTVKSAPLPTKISVRKQQAIATPIPTRIASKTPTAPVAKNEMKSTEAPQEHSNKENTDSQKGQVTMFPTFSSPVPMSPLTAGTTRIAARTQPAVQPTPEIVPSAKIEIKPARRNLPEEDKEVKTEQEPKVEEKTFIAMAIPGSAPAANVSELQSQQRTEMNRERRMESQAAPVPMPVAPTPQESFSSHAVTPASVRTEIARTGPKPLEKAPMLIPETLVEPERLALDPSDLIMEMEEETARTDNRQYYRKRDKQENTGYFASLNGLFKKWDPRKADPRQAKGESNAYALGLEAESRQNYAGAIRLYKQFIKENRIVSSRETNVESNQMLAAPYHRLAILSWKLEEPDHADFYFQQATNYAVGRNQLVIAEDYSRFLIEKGEYKQAEVIVRNVLISHPKSMEFHARLGQCLAYLDRTAESLRHYRVAYDEERAYYEVAQVLRQKKDFAMARVMDERRQRYIAENRSLQSMPMEQSRPKQYAAQPLQPTSPYSPPPVMGKHPGPNRAVAHEEPYRAR